MQKLEMNWKSFNVNLQKLDQDLRALYPNYVGNQAHRVLELWFKEEISEEIKAEIEKMWEDLTETSEKAVSYKSQSEISEEQNNKKQSAKSKLKALGLTDEEILALMGV